MRQSSSAIEEVDACVEHSGLVSMESHSMSEHKLKGGDLVSIEPWDCEGIEPPWGWDHDSILEVKSSKVKRASRIKLAPGALGLVVSFDHRGVEDFDAHYVVVVGSRKLGIPIRFLHRVQT